MLNSTKKVGCGGGVCTRLENLREKRRGWEKGKNVHTFVVDKTIGHIGWKEKKHWGTRKVDTHYVLKKREREETPKENNKKEKKNQLEWGGLY